MAAIAIVAGTYLVLAIGHLPGFRVDRTGAAIIGASLMIGTGALRYARGPFTLLAAVVALARNLTLIGSVANLIVVQRARREVQIGFWEYRKAGLPLTLLRLAAGAAWLQRGR
jgi:Na+/H+ antiporter NhaD/arsenite permease-like protein